MYKPSSQHQRRVFSRAKAQPCFQSIESVLVFWRAVSVQALDNVLFDGVQWLTRPHLSPRPLLLSSPHALPCKNQNAHRHPPTDSWAHTYTLPNTHSRFLALSLFLHPSSGGFWQLFMLLNWLSHYSWNSTRLREKEPSCFLKKGKKGKGSAKKNKSRGKTR